MIHPPVLGADHAGVVGVVVQSPLVQQAAVKKSFAALHLLILICLRFIALDINIYNMEIETSVPKLPVPSQGPDPPLMPSHW